jgi:hypothetical protein
MLVTKGMSQRPWAVCVCVCVCVVVVGLPE